MELIIICSVSHHILTITSFSLCNESIKWEKIISCSWRLALLTSVFGPRGWRGRSWNQPRRWARWSNPFRTCRSFHLWWRTLIRFMNYLLNLSQNLIASSTRRMVQPSQLRLGLGSFCPRSKGIMVMFCLWSPLRQSRVWLILRWLLRRLTQSRSLEPIFRKYLLFHYS